MLFLKRIGRIVVHIKIESDAKKKRQNVFDYFIMIEHFSKMFYIYYIFLSNFISFHLLYIILLQHVYFRSYKWFCGEREILRLANKFDLPIFLNWSFVLIIFKIKKYIYIFLKAYNISFQKSAYTSLRNFWDRKY